MTSTSNRTDDLLNIVEYLYNEYTAEEIATAIRQARLNLGLYKPSDPAPKKPRKKPDIPLKA